MDDTDLFLLLKLPYLAQKQIIGGWDAKQIIKFSMENVEIRNIVNFMRLSASCLEWSFKDEPTIIVKSIFGTDDVSIRLNSAENQRIYTRSDFYRKAPRNIDLKMSNEDDPIESMEFLTTQLRHIFNFKQYDFHWGLPLRDLHQNLFVFNITKNFGEISLTPPYDEVGNLSHVVKMMKYFQEDVTCNKMTCKIPNGLRITVPFQHPAIKIIGSSCFTWKSFQNMKSREVYIERDEVSEREINRIVKKWINGGIQSLEKFEVNDFPRGQYPTKCFFGIENLLAGIETFDSPNLPYGEEFTDRELAASARYILRKTDGRKAAILTDDFTYFKFIVWKDYVPNRDEMRD